MNEIQVIQSQLATERLHFVEVASACAAALDQGTFASQRNFAAACAEYFAFAVSRLSGTPTPPEAGASERRWREFLHLFNERCASHFATVDDLLRRNLQVTEWRARSGIDADSIMAERSRYARVKGTVP